VRKIAKNRKDKLGPQWASWVGKAVKKLVRLNLPSFLKSTDLKRAGRAGSFAAYRFQWVRGHDTGRQKSVSPAVKLF
jgi:hypothetical protein